MNLILQRLHFTKLSTCGELTIDDDREIFCKTLELPVKDGRPGSAIPAGRYKIELLPSPKFMISAQPWVRSYAEKMPHLVSVPGRSYIMIHYGNHPHDTDGCILVGLTHGLDEVGDSRKAFELLIDKIEEPARAGECWLDVRGGVTTLGDTHADVQEAANDEN